VKAALGRPEIPPAYRRPRPPIPRWQLLTLASIAAIVATATGAVANYQPLNRWGYEHRSACLESLGTFSSVHGDLIEALEFSCSKAGEEVDWAISVTNDGWLPITIQGVDGAGEPFGVVGPLEVSFGLIDRHIPRGDELEPLRPFTIRPGQVYVISFRGVTRWDCADRDTSSGRAAGIGITYKVGPFTRHDRVDAGPAMNVSCSEEPGV